MSGWTDERVSAAKKLWDDGSSASVIADELGQGITRNAVIGLVHRKGWSGRAKGQHKTRYDTRPRRTPSPATSPGAQVNGSGKHASDCRADEGRHRTRRSEEVGTAAAVERSAAALKPAPDIFEPVARPCTIADLTPSSCRWPLGDPSDLDAFRYCGAQTTNQKRATADMLSDGASPYCAGHHRLAYNGARG